MQANNGAARRQSPPSNVRGIKIRRQGASALIAKVMRQAGKLAAILPTGPARCQIRVDELDEQLFGFDPGHVWGRACRK